MKKAKKQESGPLYDQSETDNYRRNNEGPGIGDDVSQQSQTYEDELQRVYQQQAAPTRKRSRDVRK